MSIVTKEQDSKRSSLTKKQRFRKLVENRPDMSIPEVRTELDTTLQYCQNMAKELYGVPLSSLFHETKPKKWLPIVDQIPWHVLSNQEIADEYGMSSDYASQLRRRWNKPQPHHFEVLGKRSRMPAHSYRSLLEIIEFYEWWQINAPTQKGRKDRLRAFTVADIRKFLNKGPEWTYMRKGWVNNGWVRKYRPRAPGQERTSWQFTPKLYSDAKSVGVHLS